MNEDQNSSTGSIFPPSLKRVMEMFVVEGCTIKDISRHLEIPEAVVRTRLFHARVLLQNSQARPP